MSENTTARPVDTDGSGAAEPTAPAFDLEDCFAVGGAKVPLPITANDYAPVRVTFEGHAYTIKRALTGKQVREFFRLLKLKGSGVTELVLEHILESGDAAQLWKDIAELSFTEYEHLMVCLYKICGLMSAEGKFLAA